MGVGVCLMGELGTVVVGDGVVLVVVVLVDRGVSPSEEFVIVPGMRPFDG